MARPVRVIHRFAARGAGLEYVGEGGRLVSRALPPAQFAAASSSSAVGSALQLTASATSYLLPKGYPASVGPDYLPYSAWMGAATALGSAGGVLSMQALLCAVGIGGSASAPLAASLNWVIKDGLGQVAAVLSAAVISDRFDADPKRWRATAAACEVGARCIEAAAPLAPGYFLLLASTANLGKSVACLAASATRASFHKSLTRRHNLADLTGKAGSQAIASSLGGTALGLGLSTALVASPADALPLVLALSLAQLGATHTALRRLALPTLTRAAADALVAAQLQHRALPTPADFASFSQHWLPPPLRSMLPGAADAAPPPRVLLGSCPLDSLCGSAADLDRLRSLMGDAKHLIAVAESGGGAGGGQRGGSAPASEVRVLMLEGAAEDDVLLALLHGAILFREVACAGAIAGGGGDALLSRTLDRARSELRPFVSAARAAGWDLETASNAEDEVSRLVFED